jgi:hypothetical protein
MSERKARRVEKLDRQARRRDRVESRRNRLVAQLRALDDSVSEWLEGSVSNV